MSDIRFDVVGIGNAIVDIIARCDNDFLEKHGAPKGAMQLVDADQINIIYGDMGPGTEASGGSAANTMVGINSFGGNSAYIGKVSDDEFGRIFAHDIKAAGVTFSSKPVANGRPTSRSLVLVTPDGERTMNTFLGISTDLDDGEVDPDLINGSGIVYLEGYLFDQHEAKDAFRQALSLAKKANRQVALSLSDGFCVDRHRTEFLELIKSGVDIVFANEAEITSLYETNSFEDAANRIAADAKFAAITHGAKGSVLISKDERHEIPAFPVKEVVDTTGAGDLYAAGVLYGLAANLNLETAGRLGSLAAAEVISHIGARPEVSLLELAKKEGLIS